MGFIAAIPIGATQLELVRRTLNGYFISGLFLVAGSALSDTGYGFLSIFGLAHILLRHDVIAIFWLLNALILTFIGIWIIIHYGKPPKVDTSQKPFMNKYGMSFITGFSLAVTNPLMISWWILGAELLKSLGIVGEFSPATHVVFILTGGIGIASYLSLLAWLTYRAKRFLSDKAIMHISLIFGIALLALAVYFYIKAGYSFYK
jgi:threonine/homoserine/homoserine lactone efflux protein